MQDIKKIIQDQREWFNRGKTLPLEVRKAALLRLKNELEAQEVHLEEALEKDLGKSPFESYLSEIGLIKEELNYQLKNMNRLAKRIKKRTPAHQFFASSCVRRMPYGVVLIMSPWNYPFMLTMEPLVD
ncbi:MAG: aldehyde dehydrogenase family protein, partial [Oscillospiraceae bacterium]|nr:aldehyde dehydrogenase family protein [Oscillospiraceae bacterium]